MGEYRWKIGSQIKVDAQTAGEVCASLASEGKLDPKSLVNASRDEDAPLHGYFEWDDTKAAESYRENQARYIIRSIEIIPSETKAPVRAFVSVVSEKKKHSYVGVEVALANEDMREQVLGRAIMDMRSFITKYRDLAELSDVIISMKKAIKAAA